ncbi:DUF1516 family protein [Alteribacillus sp. JSM 102045]|uniref:DUF1516 family protein n=1 Tax=Alteribacillus sp. JSM 102045 TaxID=1562101 RepID=UPI0035C15B9D
MIVHYHLGSITLIIFLFIVVNHLYTRQKKRTAVILHQVLRLLYLFAALTGLMLLGILPVYLGGLFKVFLGIGSIGLMEIYFVHKLKNDAPKYLHVILIVFLSLTVIMGLMLPQGISILS